MDHSEDGAYVMTASLNPVQTVIRADTLVSSTPCSLSQWISHYIVSGGDIS